MTDSSSSTAQPHRVGRNLWHTLAFGFGSGLSPKGPGTLGSLVGLLFVPVIHWLPFWGQALFIVAATIFGCWLCGKVARDLGVHDHGGIVWDEFVGIWITFCWAPISAWTLLAGFVLFRIFDIIKPWPISWVDRQVGGGFGIMLDDVLAGIMACISLQVLLLLV